MRAILLPILVLGGAIGLAVYMVWTREAPARTQRVDRGALVRVEVLERRPHRLDVRAHGFVLPARSVSIHPQVSGQVVEMHPALIPGGILEKGTTLLKVDDREYQVAVEQAEAALRQAEAQLAIEQGQQEIAAREWELFRSEVKEGTNASLALREPQLQAARAAVQAAAARLDRAQLDVKRTVLKVPFNSFVRSESVDIGQVVGPQSLVANLAGSDVFWVQVSVPVEDLLYLDIPGIHGDRGAPVVVRQDLGGQVLEREGRVRQLLRDLDPAGRMSRLLVEVRHPFGTGQRGQELPLLVDSYVEVIIQGNRMENLIEVPRTAVHEGNKAFVFGPEEKLEIREIEIAWELPEVLLVRAGLEAGERLITSRIATPVEGAKLRLAKESAAESEAANMSEPVSGDL